jgi:hypothetical protein
MRVKVGSVEIVDANGVSSFLVDGADGIPFGCPRPLLVFAEEVERLRKELEDARNLLRGCGCFMSTAIPETRDSKELVEKINFCTKSKA